MKPICTRTLYGGRFDRRQRVCGKPAKYVYAPAGMTAIKLCRRHAKAVKFAHCTPF